MTKPEDSPKWSTGEWTICWTSMAGVGVGYHIASSPYGSVRPVIECNWPLSTGADNVEELKANAHLFLVARELYAFVEDVAKSDPVFAKGHQKQEIKNARALIARARGEPS